MGFHVIFYPSGDVIKVYSGLIDWLAIYHPAENCQKFKPSSIDKETLPTWTDETPLAECSYEDFINKWENCEFVEFCW
jgi:hypothetical protein